MAVTAAQHYVYNTISCWPDQPAERDILGKGDRSVVILLVVVHPHLGRPPGQEGEAHGESSVGATGDSVPGVAGENGAAAAGEAVGVLLTEDVANTGAGNCGTWVSFMQYKTIDILRWNQEKHKLVLALTPSANVLFVVDCLLKKCSAVQDCGPHKHSDYKLQQSLQSCIQSPTYLQLAATLPHSEADFQVLPAPDIHHGVICPDPLEVGLVYHEQPPRDHRSLDHRGRVHPPCLPLRLGFWVIRQVLGFVMDASLINLTFTSLRYSHLKTRFQSKPPLRSALAPMY